MREYRLKGIYEFRNRFYTKNLVPKKQVYGEFLKSFDGVEYREWDVERSKLGAGIAKGMAQIGIKPNTHLLYLGCSTGTTVSHVSDIIGKHGLVYALDVAPRVLRELVFLSHDRPNIIPLFGDANNPLSYIQCVPKVEMIFMDIAQPNQMEIFCKNVDLYLKKGGFAALALKARSIDVTKNPKKIFEETQKMLDSRYTLVDYRNLDPFEKDHTLYLIKK